MTSTGPAGRARRWESSWSMRPGRWTRAGGGRTALGAFCVAAGPDARHHRSVPRPPDPPTTRYRPGIAALRARPLRTCGLPQRHHPGCTDVRLTRGPRGSPPPGRALLAGALRLAVTMPSAVSPAGEARDRPQRAGEPTRPGVKRDGSTPRAQRPPCWRRRQRSSSRPMNPGPAWVPARRPLAARRLLPGPLSLVGTRPVALPVMRR